MRRLVGLPQGRALAHAELVLLVDHHRGEIGKLDPVAHQSMGPDRDRRAPGIGQRGVVASSGTAEERGLGKIEAGTRLSQAGVVLAGEEVDYGEASGATRPIRFLDRELACIDVERPVPIYVGANGPKALKAAGAYGDGRICAGNEPLGVLARNLEVARAGAAEVGRPWPEDYHAAALTFACVLRPGEDMASARVVDETGSAVVSTSSSTL